MDHCKKIVKYPLSLDDLKQLNFPTIYAKVSGFLIARTIDRYTKRETDYIKVRLSRKKNTIVGIPNLINAFNVYMGSVSYSGARASQAGIILTTSQGQQIPLSFTQAPTVNAGRTPSFASLTFTASDSTLASYTAIAEQLNTQSAGIPIELATNNVQITKQSNELLTITWTINIDISTSGNIQYQPTSLTTGGGVYCTGGSGSVSCAFYPPYQLFNGGACNCNLMDFSSSYPTSNFVTTQLFTDMFYNNYKQGGFANYTYITSNTVYIYSTYCNKYFFAGINNGSGNYIAYGGYCCSYTSSSQVNPIYLQLYYPTEPSSYIGVQITYSA